MFSILSGIAVACAGCAALWYFMPRRGKLHPLATAPLLETVIPVCIVAAFAVGVALIIAGVGIS